MVSRISGGRSRCARFFGWNVTKGETLSYHDHNGSDGTYYTYMAIYPDLDMALVLMINKMIMPNEASEIVVKLYHAFKG